MKVTRIDITVPLRQGMAHYPADPPFVAESILALTNGDTVNLSLYSLGSHTGTHIDPPYHFFEDGAKADTLPADILIGRARVIALMSGRDIALDDIADKNIEPDDIVLFKTPNSAHILDEAFYDAHVCLLPDAAVYLKQKRVRAVGIDYLSIEKDTDFPVHRILLGAGIPIIEGLNLSEAEDGLYHMLGMVMLVANGDGAPVRALLEKL